jgi:predicted HTH transcriptional regulator
MTKRDVLTKVVELVDVFTEEEREVAQKMITQLDKKSSKPTKAQIENIGIKNEMLAVIADGHARTARTVAEEVGISTAKASALLRQLVDDGKAEKIPGENTKDAPTYVGIEGATPYEV